MQEVHNSSFSELRVKGGRKTPAETAGAGTPAADAAASHLLESKRLGEPRILHRHQVASSEAQAQCH